MAAAHELHSALPGHSSRADQPRPPPRRQRPCCCRAALGAGPQEGTAPDRFLQVGATPVYLYGVYHHLSAPQQRSSVVRDVCALRPAAVVQEASLCGPTHCGRSGSLLPPGGPCATDNPQAGPLSTLWSVPPGDATRNVLGAEGAFPVEAGVEYAAAAARAALVFGDIPQGATLAALLNCSAPDLDRFYGRLARGNYAELLPPRARFALESPLGEGGGAEGVMYGRREQRLAEVVSLAACHLGPAPVVGVMGAEHLQRVHARLQALAAAAAADDPPADTEHGSPSQREAAFSAAAAQRFAADALQIEGSSAALGDLGVRRALVENILNLQGVPPGSVLALTQALGCPELAQAPDAYHRAAHLYGSVRMKLACLSGPELAAVCSGRGCELYEVLEPFRAARPANGGLGQDAGLVDLLQGLYVDVGGVWEGGPAGLRAEE